MFIPRKPQPAAKATGWQTITVAGTSFQVPTMTNDEHLRSPLTHGPDWDQIFNKSIVPGEIITTWRAGIAKYGGFSFIIDDLLPSTGAYALTGKRGSGKTSAAVTIALHVACGEAIWGRKVKAGRVLYMAGENPPDVMRRFEETATQLGLVPEDEMLLVTHGVRDPLALFREVDRLGQATGLFDLIIVDTHQSHYCGDDFNDNAQMVAMAKAYSNLAESMAGTVLVLSHPNRSVMVKSDLVPAGGGAFLNQLDGNYTIERNGGDIELHWAEKLRAPDFQPVYFEQMKLSHKRVPWGDFKSPTVVAKPISPTEITKRKATEAAAHLAILRAMASCTKNRSTVNIAEEIAHHGGDMVDDRALGGQLGRMAKAGLISKHGKGSAIVWQIEEAGTAMLKMITPVQTAQNTPKSQLNLITPFSTSPEMRNSLP